MGKWQLFLNLVTYGVNSAQNHLHTASSTENTEENTSRHGLAR